jgi:hypothetical protein
VHSQAQHWERANKRGYDACDSPGLPKGPGSAGGSTPGQGHGRLTRLLMTGLPRDAPHPLASLPRRGEGGRKSKWRRQNQARAFMKLLARLRKNPQKVQGGFVRRALICCSKRAPLRVAVNQRGLRPQPRVGWVESLRGPPYSTFRAKMHAGWHQICRVMRFSNVAQMRKEGSHFGKILVFGFSSRLCSFFSIYEETGQK